MTIAFGPLPSRRLGHSLGINRINQATLGIWLAISAGAWVYVGASHLLPAVEREQRRYSILAMAAGVLTAVGIVVPKG
jgi:zinc and cadmium transporter